jgi:hypothetical protein
LEAFDSSRLDAVLMGSDTIDDEAEVPPRARYLAERIGHEIPGLNNDPINRHLLLRACAFALEEEEALSPATGFEPITPADLLLAEDLETTGEMVLEGRVGPVPIEQVFQLAEFMPGRTCVRFVKDERRIELFFEDRHLVYAQDDQKRDGEDADPAERAQRLATETIHWSGATFELLRDVSLPEAAERARVELPVPLVLLEGLHRLEEWKKVLARVGGLGAVPVRIGDGEPTEIVDLTPSERRLLVAVDGRCSIEELTKQAHGSPFDVVRALADLRDRRVVTVA